LHSIFAIIIDLNLLLSILYVQKLKLNDYYFFCENTSNNYKKSTFFIGLVKSRYLSDAVIVELITPFYTVLRPS
jgi:hypothetical protein